MDAGLAVFNACYIKTRDCVPQAGFGSADEGAKERIVMDKKKNYAVMDGNTAAAYSAYAFTPSSKRSMTASETSTPVSLSKPQ